MREILPVGAIGLMVASFFAAAMSSAATYATTSSAMLTNYFYRKILNPGMSSSHYLASARAWCVVTIVVAAGSTLFIGSIKGYIELCLALLCFLGIPIYFGVVWRRANQTGMWVSLALGISSFLVILIWQDRFFDSPDDGFVARVFISTALSILGMLAGTLLGPPDDLLRLKRFFVIMNTPIGQEQRLVDAGIQLPALVDAGLMPEGPEEIRRDVLEATYAADAQQKIFGPNSSIELRRERLGWYGPGFIRVTLACVMLVVITWLATRMLFVW